MHCMHRLLIKGRAVGRSISGSCIVAGSSGIKMREPGIIAWVCVIALICIKAESLGALLQLSQGLSNLLQLLDSGTVTLQRLLDHLASFVLALSQFLQFGRVLLLLLEKLLVVLAGLLSLGDKLLNNGFTLVDLAGKI